MDFLMDERIVDLIQKGIEWERDAFSSTEDIVIEIENDNLIYIVLENGDTYNLEIHKVEQD